MFDKIKKVMNCFCSMLILQMNEMRRNEAQPELQKLVSKKIFQNYLFEKKFISANKETNVHVPSSITNGI